MSDSTATVLNETSIGQPAWARAAAPWAFGGAMLLSATLVFALQPMFSKMVLPRVGGGAAVWTVALVFFQGALLAGYAYAHLLTSRLSLPRQIVVHAAVLVLAGMFLPIAVASGFDAPPTSGQGFWLIALFAASVGAPFAAVSATAPLLQSWFARTGRPDANDPYYLYGASNAGSLAALLAFPLLLEPQLGAHEQSIGWTIGFVLLGLAIMGCAFLAWRAGAPAAQAVAASHATSSLRERGKWVLLGLLPSALLVAATTHITTDVASAPLLWVIPLALYLLAFIMAFSQRTWLPPRVTALALPALVAVTLVTAWSAGDWRLLSITVLGTLWLGTYVCCRALYETRPGADRLTEFYLWMSVGGVIGGALAALAAPLLFDGVLEWPIAVALTLLALPGGKGLTKPMLIIFGACVGLCLLATALSLAIPDGRIIAGGLAAGLAAIIVGRDSRTLMALACAAIIAMGVTIQHRGVAFADRSFYGAVRVIDTEDGQWRRFVHGTTLHGVQSLNADTAHTPTGYYGPLTPIGSAFTALAQAGGYDRIAILGLGAGAMACHARAGQQWTYYEIDPLVVQVAQDQTLFSFLSSCTPDAPVIVGDARLELAKQPAGAYDIILADAFSSDAVPTHLITREAMQLYLDRVSESGVVLVHVSNRNLAMAEVAERAALAAGAVVIQRLYLPPERNYANFGSQVVAIARTREALAPLLANPEWTFADPPAGRAWTDNYSNILEPFVQRILHPLRNHASPAV